MAAGFFKRAMVYLGLVDDEYEDYEEYEPRVSVGPRLAQRAVDEEDERPAPVATSTSTIRPMSRDESTATMALGHPPRRWCVPSPWTPAPGSTWWPRCSSATPARSPTGSCPTSR